MKNSTDSVIRVLIVIYAIIAGIVNWIGFFMIVFILIPDVLRRIEYRFDLSYTILDKCIRFIVGISSTLIFLPLLLIVPFSVGLGLLHEYRSWKARKKPPGPVAKE